MVKIFVGRLAPSVSASQLRQLFEKFGLVSDCDILRDYGFVHMPNDSDAQKAIKALDKYNLCGSRLSVELSTSRSMKSCQLVVKNLPSNISHDDLHKLFKKFGTVTLCKMNGDSAVIHMRFPSMANNAVRCLSGETLQGNVLSVELAVSTKQSNYQEQCCDTDSDRNRTSVQKDNTCAATSVNSALNHSDLYSLATSNPTSTVVSCGANSSSSKPGAVSNPREKRQLRIRQGLTFLQSSIPWNGTAELYQVFLNQLKEMLLHEGLDLFREGSPEKALAQISEAININSYMKMEGIKGHSEMQDRLLLERAVIKLHMGNLTGALLDADEAFNITQGNNQAAIRLKARLLAQCGRWIDAYSFLVKCHQVHTLDADSLHLLNILKQNVFWKNESLTVPADVNKNGIIGDGLGRVSQACVNRHNSKDLSALPSGITPVQNTASFTQPIQNFNCLANSSLLNSYVTTESKNNFQPRSNGKSATPIVKESNTPDSANRPASFLPNRAPVATGLSSSATYHSPCMNGLASALKAPSSEFNSNHSISPSLPSFHWNCNKGPVFAKQQSNSDKELVEAFTSKLAFNNPKISLLPNQSLLDSSTVTSRTDVPTPAYTHFPSNESKWGCSGSVLGPAMLGIATSTQSLPKPTDNAYNGSG